MQLVLHNLLPMILQLCPLPPPLPLPVSHPSCLFTWCQPLYASCFTVLLLYFSRYCTIRVKMFYFLCFYVLHVKSIMCVSRSLSHVSLFETPWTVAHQAPLSMGLSRQEYWSGVVVSYSRGSSQLRDWTHVSGVSCIGRRIPSPLSHWGSPPAEDQVINIIVTPQMGTWEIFVHSLHLVSILSLQIGREWD